MKLAPRASKRVCDTSMVITLPANESREASIDETLLTAPSDIESTTTEAGSSKRSESPDGKKVEGRLKKSPVTVSESSRMSMATTAQADPALENFAYSVTNGLTKNEAWSKTPPLPLSQVNVTGRLTIPADAAPQSAAEAVAAAKWTERPMFPLCRQMDREAHVSTPKLCRHEGTGERGRAS